MSMYQDCETCKDFCNCGCDELREREYLHRDGRDCYKHNVDSYGVIAGYISSDNDIVIRAPKLVARVKLCGGALTFNFDDTMQFEMPTKEQCDNLKKTFGIEVELVDEY